MVLKSLVTRVYGVRVNGVRVNGVRVNGVRVNASVCFRGCREAEPGGPGGLREDREVRRRGQPPPRSSVHQQISVGARRCHQRAARQTLPRPVQELPPHLPAPGLAERRQQDPHDGAGEIRAAFTGRSSLRSGMFTLWLCPELSPAPKMIVIGLKKCQ